MDVNGLTAHEYQVVLDCIAAAWASGSVKGEKIGMELAEVTRKLRLRQALIAARELET